MMMVLVATDGWAVLSLSAKSYIRERKGSSLSCMDKRGHPEVSVIQER